MKTVKCIRCGEVASIWENVMGYFVKCNDCGNNTPTLKTPNDAVEAWNKINQKEPIEVVPIKTLYEYDDKIEAIRKSIESLAINIVDFDKRITLQASSTGKLIANVSTENDERIHVINQRLNSFAEMIQNHRIMIDDLRNDVARLRAIEQNR